MFRILIKMKIKINLCFLKHKVKNKILFLKIPIYLKIVKIRTEIFSTIIKNILKNMIVQKNLIFLKKKTKFLKNQKNHR